MEIFANELSFTPRVFDNYDNITNLRDAYIKLVANGVTVCRISSVDYARLVHSFQGNPVKSNLLNFCYGFFRAPYEGNNNLEEVQNDYYLHEWSFEGKPCFGLAISYLMDSLSLSLNADKWQEIVEIDRDSDKVIARNVSSGNHVDYYEGWFLEQKNIELIQTNLAYEDKPICLRDDHGKDILLEFSKKICRSSYVKGIINSLPFNQHEKKFIHKVKDNGIVECVLCWTDAGYGLAVQTTGRNRRETEKIAELLSSEYSK